jgi:hypothetical protein
MSALLSDNSIIAHLSQCRCSKSDLVLPTYVAAQASELRHNSLGSRCACKGSFRDLISERELSEAITLKTPEMLVHGGED